MIKFISATRMLLVILLSALICPGALAQVDNLVATARVQRFGGEIAGFMRLQTLSIVPENPEAGKTVHVEMILDPLIQLNETGVPINGDSVLFIQAFGDWLPQNEVSTMVRDRTRNSFLGRQNLGFDFQAPVNPGRYRLRILFTDSGVPFFSFFGGNRLDFNASARMWIELEFTILQPAELTTVQEIPNQEFRFQPEAPSFVKVGSDFLDDTRFVPPSGGAILGIGSFGGYEINPHIVYSGDEVALTFKLHHDLAHARSPRHVVVFGNWLPNRALASPVAGTIVADLPPDDIIAVRFPAPSEPKDYRIRVMVADGAGPPRSFFGGFTEPRRERSGPDLWTEFPLRVVPRLNMFNVKQQVEKMLIFDEMPAEKQVSQFGGGIDDLLNIASVEFDPAEPAAGETVQVRVRLKTERSTDPRPIFLKLFGSWDHGALLHVGIAGEKVRSLQRDQVVTAQFRAPDLGGQQRMRVVVAQTDVVHDFYGKGVTRAYNDLLFWSEASLEVTGGGGAAAEADADAKLKQFLADGTPVIEHQPVLMAAEGVDLRLFATVVTPQPIRGVRFFYRHDNEGAFRTFDAELTDTPEANRATYGIRLKGIDDVFPTGFRYYIAVTDSGGQDITLPYSEPAANAIRTMVDKDAEPPIIAPLLPAANTTIQATGVVVKFHVFEDPQSLISGVDRNSIVMMLDGKKVFPEADVLETRFGVPSRMIFSLKKPSTELKDGQHTITVTCRDLAGNVTDTVAWGFRFRSSVATAGGWQMRGTTRSNYSHSDFGQNQPGEGSIHTENTSLDISHKVLGDATLRASGNFEGNFPNTLPREGRPVTREHITTAQLSLDSRRTAITVGDAQVAIPSGLTSLSTVRGATGRLTMKRFEIVGFYEPKRSALGGEAGNTVTSGLTSTTVDRDRFGARLRVNLTSDGTNFATWSRLYTHEYGIRTSVGTLENRGDIDHVELNMTPLKGPHQSWLQLKTEHGFSRENEAHKRAWSAALSGRIGNFNYRYDEAYGDQNFGRLALSSMRNDFAGRSITLGHSLWKNQISLSGQGGRSHNNVARQTAFATLSDNIGAGIRLSMPKYPALSYNYSLAFTSTDNQPQTQYIRSSTHSPSLSYNKGPWGLTSSYTQTITHDVISFNDNRSTSMSAGLRYSPVSEFSLGYTYSPSFNYSSTSGVKTYNNTGSLSLSYRFWKNIASLSLSHSLTNSNNSIFTSRSRSENISGGLTVTPTWHYKTLKPSLGFQFNRSENLDRMTQIKTRQETLNCSLNTNF